MFDRIGNKLKKLFKNFLDNRVLVLGLFLLPLMVVLIVRLFQLQLIRGEEYYENYVDMTKKEVSISAMRGNIYDRNGVLLAGNRVVYSVTICDENYYTKSDGAFNEMLLRLFDILERFDVELEGSLPVKVEEGVFVYDGSEAKIRRLIKDVYGETKIEDLQEKGYDPYSYDAETVMAYLMKGYYNFTSKWDGAEDVSKEDALKICNIRYLLSATSYTRYISTTVARDISDEARAAVLESQLQLYGVNVEETYERVYYNSECFSGILGYVGSITTEEIEELNAAGGDYISGDMIGKEGIESAYESYLQGKKGKKLIYKNNIGIIMKEEILEEPEQGNDIYLSIDANTTIAAYNVIEQQLAGIIVNHLYEGTDYDPAVAYEKSEYLLPIRDVYFQMINNNILSMKDMASAAEGTSGRGMYEKMQERKTEVVSFLDTYLETESTRMLNSMDEYEQAYVKYLYTYMSENGYIISTAIDTEDTVYKRWKEGYLSFPAFLKHALKNGWIDMSLLSDEERYNTVDACYTFLRKILTEALSEAFGDFDKLVYDELIHTDVISGCEVALCLFEQEILSADAEAEKKLRAGGNDTAYAFFQEKIVSMELTPAQIALDPCSAGLVLTDPNTGELLAVVSYPGYDANRINDSAYYTKLLNDLSSPLYSRATQSRLAPGSTFKMITATAALEDGYLSADETVTCDGIFDKLDHPRCWIYRLQNSSHGELDTVHALGQSCNCFFYELGYRFSLNSQGQYSISTGLSVLNKYAKMYGFGEKTGIEINENTPVLSTELPVTSAIGQGTYAFTTISLSRYLTAIASSGNVYEYKLMQKIVDREDNVLVTYTPQVINTLNFSESTWDIIHEGMYTVVHEGGSRNGDFADLRYDYAAKSGSAQENRNRPEHGWYVTYGPYDDIQYAMAVLIPNGYTSGNAALIAKSLYEYLEDDITLEEILENSASESSINDIGD